MTPTAFIKTLHQTIDEFENQPFYDDRAKVYPSTDINTTECMYQILRHAYTIVFCPPPAGDIFFYPISLDYIHNSIGIVKNKFTTIDDCVINPSLMKTLKEASHVYLHYLYQGWEERIDATGAPYLEKIRTHHADSVKCHADMLGSLKRQLKLELVILDYFSGKSTIEGPKEEAAELLRFIQAAAESIPKKPLLKTLRERELGVISPSSLAMTNKWLFGNSQKLIRPPKKGT